MSRREHTHARACFVLLKQLEVDEMRHRALVLSAAKLIREYINQPSTCLKADCRWSELAPQWQQLINLVDSEIRDMTAAMPPVSPR